MNPPLSVFGLVIGWLIVIFIIWRKRNKERKINSPISQLPEWHGVNLEDIAKQWSASKAVHPAFSRQLCSFASSIENILNERNTNSNLSRITLDDIDRLWKQSIVIDSRGSNGQKLAYFASRLEQIVRERFNAQCRN